MCHLSNETFDPKQNVHALHKSRSIVRGLSDSIIEMLHVSSSLCLCSCVVTA